MSNRLSTNTQGDPLERHGDGEGGFHTNGNFWDCECETNYIHAQKVAGVKNAPGLFSRVTTQCPVCLAFMNDSPDSREIEVQELIYGNVRVN